MNGSQRPVQVNPDRTIHIDPLTDPPSSLPYIPPSSPTPPPPPHKLHRPLHLGPMNRHLHLYHGRHHDHHHAGHKVSSFNLSGCMKLPQITDTTTKTHPPPGTSTSSSRPPPKKNHCRGHRFETTDPSSPKIGCMGQIKRKSKSSSSTSSSPSSSASSSDSRRRNKLFGLKRAFMGRSVESQASSRVRDDRGGVPVPVAVSVADLDPPLPVVRRRPVSDGNSVSLWERRCCGEALRGIQLEQPRLYLYATAL